MVEYSEPPTNKRVL